MTLIVILSLLVCPWVVCRLVSIAQPRLKPYLPLGAVVGLSLVFLFTAAGHFIRTDAMIAMLPEWMPWRRPIVYLTGILEIAFACAIVVPRFRQFTGWVIILFLVLVFPANIYSAMTRQGLVAPALGLGYLLLRTPIQLILIAWIYRFAIRQPVRPAPDDLT